MGNKNEIWILRDYIKSGTSKITYYAGEFNRSGRYNLEFHDGRSNEFTCPVGYNGNWRQWAFVVVGK